MPSLKSLSAISFPSRVTVLTTAPASFTVAVSVTSSTALPTSAA